MEPRLVMKKSNIIFVLGVVEKAKEKKKEEKRKRKRAKRPVRVLNFSQKQSEFLITVALRGTKDSASS